MTETEEQLRAILREHAADSEHLLDEVLRETLEMALTTPSEAEAERILKEAGVDVGQLAAEGRTIVATCIEEAEGHEARADRAKRSLAALRQAVGNLHKQAVDMLEWLKGGGPEDDNLSEVQLMLPCTLADLHALVAAHDVAQGPQAYVVPSGALDVAALRAAAKPMPIAAVEPTQQASGGWIEPWEFLPEPAPVPPTPTLEEVEGALRKGGVDSATARSVLGVLEARIRVSQKGAGRGE